MSQDRRPKKFVALCASRDALLAEIEQLPVLQKESQIYTKEDKKTIHIYHSRMRKIFRRLYRMMWSTPSKQSDRLILRYLCWFQYLYTAERLLRAMGGHQASITRYLMSEYPISIRRLHRMRLIPRIFGIRRVPAEFLRLLKFRASPAYRELFEEYHSRQKEFMSVSGQVFPSVRLLIEEDWKPLRRSFLKTGGTIMSDIKLKRKNSGLITQKQHDRVLTELKKGDILLTRGNWNATNAGIPGFWKHMSIYLGNGTIIEATKKGITQEPLWNLLGRNDYCVAFRTRFSDDKIDRACAYALDQVGKGYDFLFDYYCDSSMVCSELVTKSFLPDFEGDEGLDISLVYIGGAITFPPNQLVRLCQDTIDTPREMFRPVVFIDAVEKQKRAFFDDPMNVLPTWTRSRWTLRQK